MTWNYRVVHTTKGEDEAWEICEVYYDDNGKPHSHCGATVVANEHDNADKGYAESLRWALQKMRKALDKPVIEATDLAERVKE